MTASVYVLYEPGTGRILGSGYGDDVYASEMTPAGMAILFGYTGDASYHYVNEATNQVVQRPELAAHDMDVSVVQADGFDAATITGIPIGWNYEISNGQTGTTDGGDITLTALEPGTYTIKFTNWPYQDAVYTVAASSSPLGSSSAIGGTPTFRLHSNPSVTVAEMKTAAKHEMYQLSERLLEKELEALGSSRATFDLRAAEAVAYYGAGYPPFDSELYPYIAMGAEITGFTPVQVSDTILGLKKWYDATVQAAERARLGAYNYIDLQGYVETVAKFQFAWRHAFSLTYEPGATLNKTVVTPAPNADFDTIEVAGNGVDELVITLPEVPNNLDVHVIVEAFAPVGDPWRGAYYQAYTNPGHSLTLTFTDPVDPQYTSSDIKWLVTVNSPPRILQQFIVDSSTR